MRKKCTVYEKVLKDAYNSQKIQTINRENAELFEYLSKFTGDKVTNISSVEILYNTLEIETLHNLTLPSWTDAVFPGKMKDLAAQNLAIFTDNDLMKRLKGGIFVPLEGIEYRELFIVFFRCIFETRDNQHG